MKYKRYTITVMPWGFERIVWATSEEEAYGIIKKSLTDSQRDNLECLDRIDVQEAS